MRVRHPYSLTDDGPSPDATVHYGKRRRWVDVDENGVFEVPDDEWHNLEEWAEQYGYRLEDLIVPEEPEREPEPEMMDSDLCMAVTADGNQCGNPAGPDGYCHLADHGPEDD